MSYLKEIGKIGENFAAQYLLENNFSILDRNFTAHWAELDIIARKDNKILFVEVKTRLASGKGKAYEAVHVPKLYHLSRSIQQYIKYKNLHNFKFQLDVIAVYLNKDRSLKELQRYENIEMRGIY